jgi:DNA topoisomerase II
MPLWSLTQERVDKLLRRVGDKETEIDTLIKLSKEDLWKRDLDDFIAEWRFQLEDEDKRQRAIIKVTKGRRTSKKFATAATFKKRKGLGDDSGDDDFEVAKPSKKQTKITAFKAPRSVLVDDHPQTNAFAGLSKMMRKGSADGASDDPVILDNDEDTDFLEQKSKTAAKPKEAKPEPSRNADTKPKTKTTAPTKQPDTNAKPKQKAVKADSDVEEVASRPAARRARAVTKKPINYGTDSDSDNGDDLLGDVSNMVKGLPATSGDSRSFFSTSISRPGSSAGFKTTSRPPSKIVDDLSDDETDYTRLVPQQSPRRSILVTAKENNITDEDDEVDVRPAFSRQAPKGGPPVQKPIKVAAVTAKAKPPAKATKKPAITALGKKNPQSPVAKAYAKRLAKKSVVDSDDDIDAMANDILDSPGSEVAGRETSPPTREASARPARRAATTTKKATYAFGGDDDDSDDVQSGDESSAAFSNSE